jgi:hypothetical protein
VEIFSLRLDLNFLIFYGLAALGLESRSHWKCLSLTPSVVGRFNESLAIVIRGGGETQRPNEPPFRFNTCLGNADRTQDSDP